MRRLWFRSASVLLLGASPVFAQDPDKAFMTCRFDTECYAKETCAASSFDVDVKNGETGALFVLSTEFGDIEGLAVARNSYLAVKDSAAYLLTSSDAAAALTVHMQEAPTVITYYGKCEFFE